MTINLHFAILIAIMFCFIIPTFLMIFLKKHHKALKICAGVLFCVYLGLLFIGTTATINIKNSNLIINLNFNEPWFSLDFDWFETSKTNVLINLFLLFPLGFVVYTFSEKHQFLKTVLFSLLLSIIIELYQFILPVHRNTELSDIIFNTLSGVISAAYCELLKKIISK